jgi:hypothetical protein
LYSLPGKSPRNSPCSWFVPILSFQDTLLILMLMLSN